MTTLLLSLMLFTGQSRLPGEFTVYGQGLQSCGRWTEEHPGGVAADTIANVTFQAWVIGYITGAGDSGQPLRKTDGSAIAAWISNYCKDNPLDDIHIASRRLAEELRKKR